MQTPPGRDIIVAIRVTDAERKTLAALATAERGNLSNFLRRRVGLAESSKRAAPGQGPRYGRQRRSGTP